MNEKKSEYVIARSQKLVLDIFIIMNKYLQILLSRLCCCR